ncbi:MAG: cytochrome P450, partial [Acidobacteriota bacterium]|nr:cytochrome P450 [Acidobacteriota bacterium]
MSDDQWFSDPQHIDLSDMDFWRRPWAQREAAFRALRATRPLAHFDDAVMADSSLDFPPGNGYWALTRHRDVAVASRHPEIFLSGPGAVSLLDLPPEMVEYFSGMISTDNPKHARLRRIVS